MVNIEIINPGLPVVGPYNPGIKAENLIFISGQGPAQGATNIKEQTYTTLENIKKIVEAGGGKISKIVSINVYLKNMNDFSVMNETYKTFFHDNGVTESYPTRVTVEVSSLPLTTMLIEISAIAVI